MKASASLKSATPKKAWAMPQLKKVDIESITANTVGGNPDAETLAS